MKLCSISPELVLLNQEGCSLQQPLRMECARLGSHAAYDEADNPFGRVMLVWANLHLDLGSFDSLVFQIVLAFGTCAVV